MAGSLLLIYNEICKLCRQIDSSVLKLQQIVLGSSATNAWCHLKGDKSLLESDRSIFQRPHFTFFLKVLEYFNVMLALPLGRQPLELNINNQPETTHLVDPVDPVFGCTSSLWSLMHEPADVISRAQAGEM